MQPGTHDHSIIGETGSDLLLPDILLRSFQEDTTLTVFGLSSDREKHKSDVHNDNNTASGNPDVRLCPVVSRSSKVWSTFCLYRTLGILLKYAGKLSRVVRNHLRLQLHEAIEVYRKDEILVRISFLRFSRSTINWDSSG